MHGTAKTKGFSRLKRSQASPEVNESRAQWSRAKSDMHAESVCGRKIFASQEAFSRFFCQI